MFVVFFCSYRSGTGTESTGMLGSWRDRFSARHRLDGPVVKASASGAEDPGFESRLRRDFSGSRHNSDLNIGTPVRGWYRFYFQTGFFNRFWGRKTGIKTG